MRPTVTIEFRTPQQANAFAIWFAEKDGFDLFCDSKIAKEVDEKPDDVSVEFDDDMGCPCHIINVL